ncbi:MAG: hypothetical protein ACI4MJ_12475 [Aristaeellaceae bacterium]
MMYVTGDTHGELSRFEAIGTQYRLTAGDGLIVAGDFGCVFGLGAQDEHKLDALARLPYTILFLDGNHECFPKLCAYPEEIWHGGRVHRLRPNVLHLMRGQVFELDGTSVFTMGGGYSVDRALRVPGQTWWPEEMPSEAEYAQARENLARHGNRVDVIISHAAPADTMQLFVQTGVLSHWAWEESQLNCFLEEVRQTVAHERYYFGHIHLDKELFRHQIALYLDVYHLASGIKAEPSLP